MTSCAQETDSRVLSRMDVSSRRSSGSLHDRRCASQSMPIDARLLVRSSCKRLARRMLRSNIAMRSWLVRRRSRCSRAVSSSRCLLSAYPATVAAICMTSTAMTARGSLVSRRTVRDRSSTLQDCASSVIHGDSRKESTPQTRQELNSRSEAEPVGNQTSIHQ